MRQRLHLLIVDRQRRRALAARYGSRWLVPSIACHERMRASPLAARWCLERGLAGDIAGQWLGKVNEDSVDWLIAILAPTPSPGAVRPLEWLPLDSLASGASVDDYQSWALARCLERDTFPTVDGPFGNLRWAAQVRAWIATSVGSRPCAWTPYRTGAFELVLGVETARGRLYFKGLSGPRASEALMTRRFAALLPGSFAPTLGLKRRPDGTVWWLTGECPGRPSRDTPLAGAALAHVQQRLMTSVDRLPGVDLEGAALWACAGSSSAQQANSIRDACAYVRHAGIPHAWIPMDLDPSNVLADATGVRFIDVDDSFTGPAPLAMAAFARRCGCRSGYHRYAESWSPPLGDIDWRRYEIAAVVFQAHRGWESLRRNVERGEVHAGLDRVEVRIRERLATALHGR